MNRSLSALALASASLLFSTSALSTPKAKRSGIQKASYNPNTADNSPSLTKAQKGDSSLAESEPSSYARSLKSGGVALRGGYIVGGVEGGGVDVFMNRGSKLQFGASYLTGSHDLSNDLSEKNAVVTDRADVKADIYLAQCRYYFGNSFFVTGGLGQRVINVDFALHDSLDTDNRLEESLQISSTVAQIAIGNNWAWESGFFLGAEWIGYLVPLSSSKSSSVKTEGVVSIAQDEFQKMAEDAGDSIGMLPTPQALLFSAGFMF